MDSRPWNCLKWLNINFIIHEFYLRERERESKGAQIAIGQREQNIILVSWVLKDKIKEGREIFRSHTGKQH